MLKTCISRGWKYADFPSTEYTDIDLPHDAAIGKPRDARLDDLNGYFQVVNGKYVKYLTLDGGKHYILDIDGAYSCAEVTLNEQLLFLHPHGYTPLLVDLTDHVIPEIENKLVITPCPIPPVGTTAVASTVTSFFGRAAPSALSRGICSFLPAPSAPSGQRSSSVIPSARISAPM